MNGGMLMELKIGSTKDVVGDGLFILVHGRSGAGKTSLAKTIPTDQKVLVVSAEGGCLPLKDLDLDMVTINRFEDMDEVLKLLEGDVEYQWIFVDSLTEIGDQCLKAESRVNGRMIKPNWDSYYWFGAKMEEMIRKFRDLCGLHVVLTALSGFDSEFDDGKLMPVIPAQKFRAKLSQYFDEVLYLSVDREGKRLFVTDCNPRVEAKDRSGDLDNPEVPDLSVIVNKIYGEAVPERKITPSPEREKLLGRIANGETAVAQKQEVDEPIIRKDLWEFDVDIDEASLEQLNAYYHLLLGTFQGNENAEDTGSQGD